MRPGARHRRPALLTIAAATNDAALPASSRSPCRAPAHEQSGNSPVLFVTRKGGRASSCSVSHICVTGRTRPGGKSRSGSVGGCSGAREVTSMLFVSVEGHSLGAARANPTLIVPCRSYHLGSTGNGRERSTSAELDHVAKRGVSSITLATLSSRPDRRLACRRGHRGRWRTGRSGRSAR